MPSHSLPDLNTAYITYRREIINCLRSENYRLCVGHLHALNSILPKQYQIVVSNIQYNKATGQKLKAKCFNCSEEHDYKALNIKESYLTPDRSFLAGKRYEKVWQCPSCHNDNKLENTEFEQTIPEEPYFLQVVPKPPERRDGVMDRKMYNKKMKVWSQMFLIELEHQLGKYRVEYIPKGEREQENMLEETEEDLTEFM